MSYIVIAILAFILGVLLTPMLIFLRARKDEAWDKSNMTNIYRVVAHLASHPSDFGKMYYQDGYKPFWYIDDDEFSDVVRTRPGLKSSKN
jgi:hypothetical protein